MLTVVILTVIVDLCFFHCSSCTLSSVIHKWRLVAKQHINGVDTTAKQADKI